MVDVIERLERRQTESEIRLATAITAMAGTLIEVRDLLKERAEVTGPLMPT